MRVALLINAQQRQAKHLKIAQGLVAAQNNLNKLRRIRNLHHAVLLHISLRILQPVQL